MTTTIEATAGPQQRKLTIEAPGAGLVADLRLPEVPVAAVVFPHAGSSRLGSRLAEVTETLNLAGLATLTLDLLTDEEAVERESLFDVQLLGRRLGAATERLREETGSLPLGYLGVGTAGAAALWAAANEDARLFAVVALGGWPDLVGARLSRLQAPTLLVVGGVDSRVLELNRAALAQLSGCEREVAVVPGATHLFEQAGALAHATSLAAGWFVSHLPADGRGIP